MDVQKKLFTSIQLVGGVALTGRSVDTDIHCKKAGGDSKELAAREQEAHPKDDQAGAGEKED